MGLLFLVACGGHRAAGDAPRGRGGSPAGGPPAARVEVGKVRRARITTTYRVLGEVRALERAAIAPEMAGTVVRLHVHEGDLVARGALLATLDGSLAAARLDAARASLRSARAEAEQASRDAERGLRAGAEIVAGAELERGTTRSVALEARAAAAEADERAARETASRYRLVSPYAGQVGTLFARPGDFLQAGESALEIVGSGIEVVARLPPDVAALVDTSAPVTVHAGSSTVPGHIVGLVRAIDTGSRSVLVRVQVEDASALWPGASVDVSVQVTTEEGLVVPRDAVVLGAAGARVIRVVGGTASLVQVSVRGSNETEVLVAAPPLNEGDDVIVRGNERVRPDQPVVVVDGSGRPVGGGPAAAAGSPSGMR